MASFHSARALLQSAGHPSNRDLPKTWTICAADTSVTLRDEFDGALAAGRACPDREPCGYE